MNSLDKTNCITIVNQLNSSIDKGKKQNKNKLHLSIHPSSDINHIIKSLTFFDVKSNHSSSELKDHILRPDRAVCLADWYPASRTS